MDPPKGLGSSVSETRRLKTWPSSLNDRNGVWLKLFAASGEGSLWGWTQQMRASGWKDRHSFVFNEVTSAEEETRENQR